MGERPVGQRVYEGLFRLSRISGSHLLVRDSPAGPVFLTRARADAYYPASMAHEFLAA